MGKHNRFSRRMFLHGLGVALPIPLLPSLLPRQAWAQANSPIRRYFSIVGPYDYGHHQHWFPTLNQPNQVHDPGNGDHRIRYQPLSSFVGSANNDLSLILGRGLNPFLNKMNLLRGLNLHTRIGHGKGHMLGNIAATDGHDTQVTQLTPLQTIDQVLATNRNFTPYDRDPLVIGHPYTYRRNASGQVSQVSSNWRKPHDLFNSLFQLGGQPLPENGGTSNQAHPRADLLTRVFEDYQRVRNGRQISQIDRQVLDNAMDRISDIQSRLGMTQSASGCRYSSIDTNRSRTDGLSSAYYYNFQDHSYAYNMYAQIFAAAASCDLHRVFDFHGLLLDHFDRHPDEDFHQGHSHRPWSVVASNNNRVNHRWMAEIYRMFVDSFLVPLLTQLESHTESNGQTMLDNSLVHFTIESSTVHSDYSKPCLFVGGAGGALTTGHLIDYSRRELGIHPEQGDNFSNNSSDSRFGHIYYGAHYNRSLTTVLQAMGLQPSDYENPSINRFFQGRNDGLLGTQNNNISRIGGYGHIGSETSGVWYYSNQELYQRQYARYNYHFYKNPLPFPPRSAS